MYWVPKANDNDDEKIPVSWVHPVKYKYGFLSTEELAIPLSLYFLNSIFSLILLRIIEIKYFHTLSSRNPSRNMKHLDISILNI